VAGVFRDFRKTFIGIRGVIARSGTIDPALTDTNPAYQYAAV
jgi:hypothetical protein